MSTARIDWGKWRDYRSIRFSSLSDDELVACKTCGRPTDMKGTKKCDGCWEVESRIGDYVRDGGEEAVCVLGDALEMSFVPAATIAGILRDRGMP